MNNNILLVGSPVLLHQTVMHFMGILLAVSVCELEKYF